MGGVGCRDEQRTAAERVQRQAAERKVPMKETLPERMIAVLEELGKQLAAMTKEQRGAALASLEKQVLGAVRSVLPDILGEVLRASIRELQPPACHWRQSCPR